ncbi:hypothetical protein LAZ67_1006453 [Cordylochernes scorpioides]|uniref:Integrase catalytic domain-containing protein n=1 Tax=Cordylochernes scorpioides TaxID=51811 RepID=A0ABY6JYY6_9ARAC|nr:hypothetical protein LAZ67_1006453 [Cordylochernes scorpioides]
MRTLHQLARDKVSTFPVTSKIVQTDFYVDDLLSGADTIEEATCHIREVNNLLSSAGFSLRKWRSNVPEVLSGLSEQSIFARHGIPEEVRSDNGPQFGLEFKRFEKEYGFHHITSSPRFPQSSGFIESIRSISSLLDYRTAPLENGYNPAELCMNRKLRTIVPISPVQLQSRIPDLENLEMREKYQRHKKKKHFVIHHRARELPHLDEGTRVWVKDLRVPCVVLEDAGSPRSYIGEKIDKEDEEMESPEMSQGFTSTGDNTTCDSEPRTFQRSSEPVKTRSGRVIKPPDRLDL